MLKFKLNNVYTEVSGYTTDTRNIIDECTSGQPEGYQFSKKYKNGVWDGYIRLFRRNKFPTGLYPDVVKRLCEENIVYTTERCFRFPETVFTPNKLCVELRDYQKACVSQCGYVDHRGIIQLPPNSGKTEIGIALVNNLGVKTLWLSNRVNLVHQTVERFNNRLKMDIGVITSKVWNPSIITVASVDTLVSRFDNDHKVKDFLNTIGCVISDECDHVRSRTWYDLLTNINAYYRYGFSATPFKGVFSDLKVIGAIGKTIFKIDNYVMIADKISAKPDFKLINVTNNDIHVHDFAKWSVVEDKLIINNDRRNERIVNEALLDTNKGDSVLILFNKLRHGSLLYRQISLFMQDRVVLLSGKDDPNYRDEIIRKFTNKDILCIIASTIFDEGISLDGGMQTLIVAGGGKSKQRAIQRLGRALRKNKLQHVKVIDFYDSGKYVEDHSKERINAYIESGLLAFNYKLIH